MEPKQQKPNGAESSDKRTGGGGQSKEKFPETAKGSVPATAVSKERETHLSPAHDGVMPCLLHDLDALHGNTGAIHLISSRGAVQDVLDKNTKVRQAPPRRSSACAVSTTKNNQKQQLRKARPCSQKLSNKTRRLLAATRPDGMAAAHQMQEPTHTPTPIIRLDLFLPPKNTPASPKEFQ